VGTRREAVRVVVSFVATVAKLALLVAAVYLPFAWWGHVKSNGDEVPYCTDVFRVGRPLIPSDRESCLNEAGEPDYLIDGKQYDCGNGSFLDANKYGWWKSDDSIVKALTARGAPPRAALDGCRPFVGQSSDPD
jgi:hypothetical protein